MGIAGERRTSLRAALAERQGYDVTPPNEP